MNAAGTAPSLSTRSMMVMGMYSPSRAPRLVSMLRARCQQFSTSVMGKSCVPVGRVLAPAQASSDAAAAKRILRIAVSVSAHRFQGLGQLRKSVRIGLAACDFLPSLESGARLVLPAQGLQQHAVHEICREII